MRKRIVLHAFCGCLLAAGLTAGISAARAAEGACSADNALAKLPAPLSKWGQIICTQDGQVITGNEGWVWLQPDDHSEVAIPANLVDGTGPDAANGDSSSSTPDAAKTGGAAAGHSYFTKADIAKVSGDESDRAYATFHDGFDPNEEKPIVYRLDLTSESGKAMRMYFFDYFSYGWGMMCPSGVCSRDSRFMMLDMNERPKELPPPI